MKGEMLEKYKVLATLRDAEWQIKQMKQTHFAKADVLEMLEDLVKEFNKE